MRPAPKNLYQPEVMAALNSRGGPAGGSGAFVWFVRLVGFLNVLRKTLGYSCVF